MHNQGLPSRSLSLQSAGGVLDAQLGECHSIILMDELARIPTELTIALAAASHVAAPPILNAETVEQKIRWHPGLFTWETSFYLGAVESSAGSDISNV